MISLVFKPCLADHNYWARLEIKSDVNDNYEHVLLHTDDALVVSENDKSISRKEIGKYFKLKEELVRSPQMWLSVSTMKAELDNDIEAWSFNSSQHINNTA